MKPAHYTRRKAQRRDTSTNLLIIDQKQNQPLALSKVLLRRAEVSDIEPSLSEALMK